MKRTETSYGPRNPGNVTPLKPLDYYLKGIYISHVEESDGPDGTEYRASLKSHPRIFSTGSSPDDALRALEVIKATAIRNRWAVGVPPPEPDGHRTPTLTGRLHR